MVSAWPVSSSAAAAGAPVFGSPCLPPIRGPRAGTSAWRPRPQGFPYPEVVGATRPIPLSCVNDGVLGGPGSSSRSARAPRVFLHPGEVSVEVTLQTGGF